MAKMAASRFAVLKIEDDEDDIVCTQHSRQQVTGKSSASKISQNKSKKNKKKKGLKVPATEVISDIQWKEWKEKDEGQLTENFKKDIQQAIESSRLDLEENSATGKRNGSPIENDKQRATSSEDNNKKSPKKKGKGQAKKDGPISLAEFQNLNCADNNSPEVKHSKLDSIAVAAAAGDGKESDVCKFFDEIEKDTRKAIDKEHRQDAIKDSFQLESRLRFQYENQIAKHEKLIAELQEEVSSMKEGYAQVKKRNKQLCFILGQGEMKEKAELLQMCEDFKQGNKELMEQLNETTQKLEQERSESHRLREELKRLRPVSK